MEIKYVKSVIRLLNRYYVNKGGLDLSKEVLWSLFVKGQQSYGLSKLEVKKNSAAWPGAGEAGSNFKFLGFRGRKNCSAEQQKSENVAQPNFFEEAFNFPL